MLSNIVFLIAVMVAGSGPPLHAQSGQNSSRPASAPAGMLVDIILERRKDGKIEQMAATHVFTPGDIVRLRLKSHYDGYLYVLDQGTSGKSSTIFPAAETGSDNRVRQGQEYLVPAVEDGWFEVEGPPGFDVLFFLLSPAAMPTPAAASMAAPGPVSSLKPRCNDDIFKARGECMDDTAGPAAAPPGKPLPPQIAPMALGASRDLVFVQDANGTVGVKQKPGSDAGGQSGASGGAAAAPILYTFRLAHN